jgi:hypothetical protein
MKSKYSIFALVIASTITLAACKPSAQVDVNANLQTNSSPTPEPSPTPAAKTTESVEQNEKPLSNKDDADSLDMDLNATVVIEDEFN